MTRTAPRHEVALALDDLDVVIGGSASPMATYHPIFVQAPGSFPGADTSSTSAIPSAANNFGLTNHFNLMFPGMAHDGGHTADGVAPNVPGGMGAPGAAGQDAQAHGSCHGTAGTDDHGTPAASLPLSLVPIPGELTPPASPATDAAQAPADPGAAIYLGLPGGTDATHADASHPATNDWAPGSFTDSTPASPATDSTPASPATSW